MSVDTVHAFVGPVEVLVAGAAQDGGTAVAPLAGVTLAVKDVIDVAGRVTGAGNPDLAATRAPADRSAPAVDALVAAGATVVGKTVTDELAYSLGGDNPHFALPINVAASGRSTGGSSSGSAAAVAAGLVEVALGTDTGGSIRVPASYCGIYGWRPTHGAVSVEGVTPLSPSFDTVGLLARSPTLLRRAAEVMLSTGAGSSATDAGGTNAGGIDAVGAGSVRAGSVGAGSLRRPTRLAIVGELFDVVESDVAAALRSAVHDRFGEMPERVELGVDLDDCLDAFRTLQGAEAWAAHGEWITSSGPVLAPATAARFEAASKVTAAQVAGAQEVRDRVRSAFRSATAGGTVLVAPPAAGGAPLRGGTSSAGERVRAETLRLSSVAGLAGAPVVVAPGASIGADGTDLPFGIALMGAAGVDLELIELCG